MSSNAARMAVIGVALVVLGGCGPSSGGVRTQGSTPPRSTSQEPSSGSTTPSGQTASSNTSPTSPASTSSTSPAAGPTAAPSRSSGAPAASVPRCTTSHLRASLAGTEGAAGSAYDTVRLTNTGTATCTLYGYPGVSLVGHGDGTQIGAAATRDRTIRATTVSVRPGGSAMFVVRRAQALNYPQATCEPTPADGYRIYPPDQTAALFLPLEGATGCAKSSVELLTVRPVGALAG